MTFAALRALHAIIGTAIDDIERVYRPDTAAPSPAIPRSPPPVPILKSPPRPARPPRSPHRHTHLPSPPSYSPSPPPLPSRSRSRSRSPSPSLSSQCSHTIDFSALPTPISVKFAIPSSKSQVKQRSRAQTLPSSVNPLAPKHPNKQLGASDVVVEEPQVILDWPDLDQPFAHRRDTTNSPPKSKAEKEEELTTNIDVIKAVNQIVAACAQLSAAVQRPFLTLCDAAMGYHLPSCLRFLEASHTVEILREAGPQGLHVKDISRRISERRSSGFAYKDVDPGTLSHILRLLATHHITREVRPDVFTNNRLSSFIDSGKDVTDLVLGAGSESKYEGTDGIGAFIGLCCDELFKASAYLTDCYLLPGQSHIQFPLSPTLTSPTSTLSPINDRGGDRHPQSTIRAHAQRSSDTSSFVSETNLRIRSWDEDVEEDLDGPETPKTPRTSPGQQANSPSAASQASLTPPTFAPNANMIHARRPSLTLVTQSLLAPQQEHLSSPISLRRQPPRFPKSPAANASLTSLSSYDNTLLYPPAFDTTFQSSTQSLTNLAIPPSPNMLLPPVSIPTHKASFASLASPTHKSSFSSLSSLKATSSPLATGQLSPVQEKTTPGRKRSQSFLRRIGSKALLGQGFKHGTKEEISPPLPWDGGYMRGDSTGDSLSASPHPSISSLRSPGSLISLRRGHVHTTSTVSSSTNASASLGIPSHTESPPDVSASEDSSSPPPPPVPPKPMHITASHPMHAPFNLAFRTTQPYFEWLERPENGSRLKRFGKAMTGTSGWEVPGAILDSLHWEDLPPCSVVVDVGGGIGSTSMLLANAFKHLRFVVQDRDPVVEMGLAAWKDRCPNLLSSGQAAFQAHDFLTPQPTFPESLDLGSPPAGDDISDSSTSSFAGLVAEKESVADATLRYPAVYLLRVITHDWPDEFVTRILLHLRNAAGPDTKLLIADHLLPLACVDEDDEALKGGADGKREALPGTVRSLAPDGSPLLPNLGKANANAYWMDLTMRVTFNSQERTLRELASLTLTAGWKVEHVSRAEGSLFGHVVAVPVDIPPESLALLKKTESAKQNPVAEAYTGRSRSGTITDSPTIYSPPMGDTFFTQVYLPSDELIRTQTQRRLFRFARPNRGSPTSPGPTPSGSGASVSKMGRFGLGLGLEGIMGGSLKRGRNVSVGGDGDGGEGGKKKAITVGGYGGRKRANTIGGGGGGGGGSSSRTLALEIAPPLPLPFDDVPLPQSPTSPRAEGKKATWSTLRRMLSKPQLLAGVGGSPGSVGTSSTGSGNAGGGGSLR